MLDFSVIQTYPLDFHTMLSFFKVYFTYYTNTVFPIFLLYSPSSLHPPTLQQAPP